MVEKAEIRREAKERQGTFILSRRAKYFIEGDQKRARFQTGAEGLVQPAVDQLTQKRYRIKVFWEPTDRRLARSRTLVKRALANHKNSLDVLAGAPFAILDSLGGSSRFAVIMKNVDGVSWKDLRRDAEYLGTYPPPDWPSFRTRWLWAYGLVSAVEKMEALNFVHADLSDGNVMGVKDGDRAGELALVDFDAYFNPQYPSDYLGTSGFVAPEIWTQGAIGIGSDRLAMAILVQDFLLVGDPDLSATDAFQIQYTQEKICALECRAHPLLRQKFPAVADLLDKTLTAPSRDQRPSPLEWQEALRTLSRQRGTKMFRLAANPSDAGLVVALRPGETKDLTQTPFGIRADIVLRESLRIRPHPGSSVLFRPVDGTWQELTAPSEAEIFPNWRLFDRVGKMPAEVFIDKQSESSSDTESQVTLESYDQATPQVRPDWLKNIASQTDWKRVGAGLGIVLALLLLLLLYIHSRSGQVSTVPPPFQSQPVPSEAHTDTGDSVPSEHAKPDAASHAPAPLPPPTPAPAVPTTTHQNAAMPSTRAHIIPFKTKAPTVPDVVNTNPTNPNSEIAISHGSTETQVAPIESKRLSPETPSSAKEQSPQTIASNVYRGPPSGDFLWSGTIEKGQVIEIVNGTSNIGSVSGQPLPGVPVSISISRPQIIAVVTQPNPLNHFSTIAFRSRSKGQIAFGVHWVVLPVE